MPQEVKDKISKSRTGQSHTDVTRKKISNNVRGGTKPSIPLEVILKTDLKKAYTAFDGRYINVYFYKDESRNFDGGVMRLADAVMVQKLKRHLSPGEQCHHTGSVHDNFGEYDLHLCASKKEHCAVDFLKKRRQLIKEGQHELVKKKDIHRGYNLKSVRFCKKYTKQERADRRWNKIDVPTWGFTEEEG